MIEKEAIEKFLEGKDEQKYIVKIHVPNYENVAYKIIRHPQEGKKIQKERFKPFLWFNPKVFEHFILDKAESEEEYNKKKLDIKRSMDRRGVEFKALEQTDENGHAPPRIKNGYTHIAHCSKSWSELLNFFKEDNGLNLFEEPYKEYFTRVKPVEQFMIQSGKRLFKGFEDYKDVQRFYFDLETEGIDPSESRIFQIGVRDSIGFDGNGYEEIIEVTGETNEELRKNERKAIRRFFHLIDELKPDIIAGYNSEGFDWPFIEGRCDYLKMDIDEEVYTLTWNENRSKYIRNDNFLKLGNETERYTQTYLEGYNVLDTSHAVRKAKAINSDIKKWDLKYITQYIESNKKDRVYIPGDKLFELWSDTDDSYAWDPSNGDWYEVNEDSDLKEGYERISGKRLVERYLKDDLWETEEVDDNFSQATFLIGKLIPTDYMRNCTMGTSGTWKLIMLTWSYENDLAVPQFEDKKDFPGGLSRMLLIGRSENVVKLDYSALYPRTELTHNIFPDLDISHVMKGLLEYIVNTRDEYKSLKGKYKKLAEGTENEGESHEYDTLSKFYDKKQLPLKILANSFFGSFGAPHIFPWGETICAGETTCRGRQYLRLLVWFFVEIKGYTPLVGDSVTEDMPVYIKYNDTGEVDIVPIQSIFEETTIKNEEGQERDLSEKDYRILTNNGWRPINYVYRHRTNKNIHQISTRDRLIECTEDHSLFSNEKEISPNELDRGDEVDVHDIELNSDKNDISYEEAWLLGFFVADGSSVYKNRKTKNYFSKKKNRLVEYNGKRGEWTISNKDRNKLERAQKVVESVYGIKPRIKDYSESSNCLKLKTSYASISIWFSKNCYDDNRNKKIPTKILNASHEIKRSFMDGFALGDGWGDSLDECKNITQKHKLVMAGINCILKDLGIDFTLNLRKDKPNIISYNLGEKYKVNESKSIRKRNEIWKNDIIEYDDKYVYDVSADGTFICGIGGFVAHNTDGFNFSMPEDVEEHIYTPEGGHIETENDKGKELTGLDADVAEFNEKYMIGYMGLDVDEIAEAEINFSKKNYVTLQDGEIKKTGNTLKSDILESYISEFMDEGLKLLLEGKGYEFIQNYYDLVDDLYNYRVPISKIASKSKIKMNKEQYKEYCSKKKKDGTPNSRQSWMELVLHYDMDVSMGDVIYYYNTGTAKSHGDVTKVTNKETGEQEIKLNCDIVPNSTMENHPDQKVTDYNVPKYIDKLNKRIKPLLVCFSPEIRDNILIGVKKDKKTKAYVLEERREFTKKECELVSGYPFKEKDQDDYYEDLMKMEDKEIDFWINKIQKTPNNINEDEWERLKKEYAERLEEQYKEEIKRFDELVGELELDELETIRANGGLPHRLSGTFKLIDGDIYSSELNRKVGDYNDIFKYEREAEERSKYYNTMDHKDKRLGNKYESWKVDKLNRELDGHSDIAVIPEEEIKGEIAMREKNISLIKQGLKTATARGYGLENGLWRIKGDGTIIELEGYHYEHIDEMKNPERWAKAEGFKSLEDMKENCYFDRTREFVKGNIKNMYIYIIKNVYPS